MPRLRIVLVLLTTLFLTGLTFAGDAAPPLLTSTGAVDKVEKDTLTIRPRGAGGKFEKNIALKVTGTSEVTTLTTQKRAGKVVVVQKKTEIKDLQPNQTIAVIYTTGASGSVLLTAVVLPATDK
jgi:hypothetical protein